MKGWKQMRISDIVEPLTKVDPRKTPGETFEYIDVSSVSRFTSCVESTSTVQGCKAPSRARRQVHAGDVLFATIRPTLKRIAIVPQELDNAVCSTGYFVLRPNSRITSRFLFYSLFNQSFMDRMASLQRGASYPAVSDRDVKEHLLPLPPLPEQERIVGILDEAFAAIDTATQNTQKNLNNAKELFERLLDTEFETGKQTWVSEKFGSLCDFVRGPFGGSLKKSCFVESGFAVYEQQHAINNQFEKIRYFVDEQKFLSMSRFELRPGDLIMSCSGTMGKVAIAPQKIQPGIINQALLKLTPQSCLLAEFLRYWMQSKDFQEQIAEQSKGAAIKNVASVKILKEISVPLPPIEVQRSLVLRILDLRAKAETLFSSLEQKLSSLSDLKQSLLQKAFSGKL